MSRSETDTDSLSSWSNVVGDNLTVDDIRAEARVRRINLYEWVKDRVIVAALLGKISESEIAAKEVIAEMLKRLKRSMDNPKTTEDQANEHWIHWDGPQDGAIHQRRGDIAHKDKQVKRVNRRKAKSHF